MQTLSVFIGPVLPSQLFYAPCRYLFLLADQIVRERKRVTRDRAKVKELSMSE